MSFYKPPILSEARLNFIARSDQCRTPIRIACLGDSLTRGDGSHEPFSAARPPHKGRGNYPALLDKWLGKDFVVMNFGRGGTTACETNVPFDRTRQFRSAKSFKPHLVILMLGTNDAKDTNWGVRCNETSLAARLASISSAMRVHKSLPPPPTLLLEPPAIYKEKWRIRKSNLVEVRKAVRKYVHGNNATRPCTASSTWLARPLAIDERAHPWRYFMDDGVHLNEKGSRLLACSAFMALQESCIGKAVGEEPACTFRECNRVADPDEQPCTTLAESVCRKSFE